MSCANRDCYLLVLTPSWSSFSRTSAKSALHLLLYQTLSVIFLLMDYESDAKIASVNGDEEFVVPHMDIACLQNSLAYQKVLEEPWTYLHNWNTLAPSVQQQLARSFLNTLAQVKGEMAITQGVFDPYIVNEQSPFPTESSQLDNGRSTQVPSTSTE
ncbi:unnamed protein product [Dicrocoelium dendriticum]|nr:unnamed protein product [Dicrocoelium dendriticum]